MIYLNTNKFLLNDFVTFPIYKDEISDKKNVIKLMREKLEISDNYSIFSINNIYEAYTLIIHSIISSYTIIDKQPHIICNKMEDPKILEILKKYIDKKDITIAYAKSTIYGTVNADEIEKLLKKNKPCVVINSLINNFTGSINNIKKIGEISHKYKAPLFCDCTYAFGKLPINPDKNNIDILTIDMNYPGLSFIVIKNDLLRGYQLSKYSVKFNNDVESYTEEDPHIYGLAASIINSAYKNRQARNKKLIGLKKYLLKKLNYVYYNDYIKSNANKNDKKYSIIVFGSDIDNMNTTSPHIISFLLIKNQKINNIKLCDIDNDVFTNIGINDKWKSHIIVVGLSDYTSKKDIDKLLKTQPF